MMYPTPGITQPNLTRDPLGTEGELTPGPDDYNPFDDPDNAAPFASDRQRDAGLPSFAPSDPTEGADPFAFDDVEPPAHAGRLPFMDSQK